MNVDPNAKNRSGWLSFDPKGEKLSDNRIWAKQLSTGEAYKLYG